MSHYYAKNLSRDEIIARGRSHRLKVGKPLSFRRFCKLTGVPAQVVGQMFGGWRRLRRILEPEPQIRSARKQHSHRQLVQKLKEFDKEGTDRITEKEFCALAGITRHELHRLFGSWRQFREAAGQSRRSKPRRLFTNRELLDELLLNYLRTGKRPERCFIERLGGKHRVTRLLNRFGSWKMVEFYFDVWVELYFRKGDMNWTMTEHERTFVPDPNANVEWPPDKAGLDWDIKNGWVHPDKL